jgi:hypothetical protein
VPETPPARRSGGRLEFVAQIGSLIATAWLVGNVVSLPAAALHVPRSAILRAVEFTLLAWLWSVAVALALQLAIRRVEQVEIARATLRTSMVAIWFAPATLLVYQFSPATVAAALVLVVNATRMLYSQWRTFNPASEAVDSPWEPLPVIERGELPPPMLTRNLGPALSVACALQLGVTAVMFRHHFLAGTLLTMSAALLTVFAISAGAWESSKPPTMPRAIFAVFLTMLLAAGLTILATGFHGFGTGLGDGGDSAGSQAPALPPILTGPGGPSSTPPPVPPSGTTASAPRPSGPPPLDPSEPGFEDIPGSFPGVILWPEVKPVTILIAPMPSTPGNFVAAQRPLGIPFGGEYWFFRWPNRRPPRTSFVRRGSPSKVSFSTTDNWPLNMEAHQKLEQDIDISCCSRIELSVLNADRYPHSVSLELILHEQPEPQAQSLGIVPVDSVPNLGADPITPLGETLSFAVPPEPTVREFNELTVVYHRMNSRKDKSARIAIDRFILIPRGR